ncbi:EamA family transporter [Halorarum salinum]|uniref:EamA family transporter n=1 Tax=Halorarum salinum TaxID=2743089 RepID=A0A7D5QA52_9EURY|nr:EamA family transporter [Halobaculum salinum]QLG62177.1 EamA family transporter [Halobaculum salinum]
MNYLPWAVLALLSYSMVAPLMRVATSGANPIPSNVAALVANAVLVLVTLAVIGATGEGVVGYLDDPKMRHVFAAGACLAVGILAYYRALSMGPVSIVAPVFAMFFVTSSLVGVLALEEPVTARKVAGVAFAVLAVLLVAGE